jgi:hypothetical protein
MFSNYLKYLLEKLRFYKVVVARFLIILFRRKKGIELLRLEYDTEHLFDKSFIVINYKFRNGIYYRFGNHKTLEKEIKIFNLKNFEKEFELTVYGFFRKESYKLKFEPKFTLEISNFKTSFSNLQVKLEQQLIPKLTNPLFYPTIEKLAIATPKAIITNNTLNIKTKTYNQNEFI